MNVKHLLLTAVAAIALPSFAWAFDLSVTYDVDASALKAAVAGTPLTFQLHTDASCLTPAIDSRMIDVEDVATIEVLKRFTPKNGTKPPKTARFAHVLTGVPVRSSYHLSVSGLGVTPVG